MAGDNEPNNNQSATPDDGGRLSASNADGAARLNFAFHTVQSGEGGISGSTFRAAATDPVDYIAFSLNPNVGSVDLTVQANSKEDELLNQGGVFGVRSQYTFAPGGAFSGSSVSVQVRAGSEMYGSEAADLLGDINRLQQQDVADYTAKARAGVDDAALNSQITATANIIRQFSTLYESNGTNVDKAQSQQVALDIRNASQGLNASARSPALKADATRLSQIASDWQNLHYFRADGASEYREISSLDFNFNTKVSWAATPSVGGAPTPGIVQVTGGVGLRTNDLERIAPADYSFSSLNAHAGPVVCFTTGTLIRTARGEVAVEELRVGDHAVTASGALRPVVWIGHRHIDGAGKALHHDQQPIHIRAGAFGAGLPARDLRLSPGHPVLVGADQDGAGGHLVPVMCLINGTSIAREPAAAVTYWHVELDAHDILLAEGLPAESYLDWGDRPFFTQASDHALHNPDFIVPGLAARCRPVAVDGPVVEAERARLSWLFAAELAAQCAWDAALAFETT
ncbi:Hint domain-containing protein [Methylobacterium aquaticum]|uniref:Hint domain-containing protein n=1 Tax=Methylobacterium aquaticum TaxID=270351 RepID=UPI001FEF549D|nr:Hint domain-containing protein [Methylobacterium aquaticum]